jgi:hypothetical protein
MAESKARSINKSFNPDGTVNSNAVTPPPTAAEPNPAVIQTLAVYDSLGLLPTTGLTVGNQAYVSSSQRLYLSNGSGWYNVALINATPSLSLSASGTIALANDGTATVITMTATDSDNADASLVLTVESGGDFFKMATLSQDSSVFTITPRSEDSAVSLGYDGTSTLTFKASDGVSFASEQNTFTLAFTPDWTGTVTESVLESTDLEAADNYGSAVAISADGTHAIGAAPYEHATGTNRGAVYSFTKSGSTWSQQAKIIASDAGDFDNFGEEVDISDDGTYLVVGATHDDDTANNSGAAYVFIRSGTSWSQQAKLKATSPTLNDNLGFGVSISGDGNYVAVSHLNAGSGTSQDGAVEIFIRSGTSWSFQQKIQSSDIATGDFFGGVGNQPGVIKLNEDGTYLIVGAYGDDTSASAAGAAYIFTRSDTTWSQQAKIVASDPTENKWFGRAVSISNDAAYAICGAYRDNTDAGAAYVFVRSGTSWSQQAKLVASDAASYAQLGYQVDLNSAGTIAAVSANKRTAAGSLANAGAVYVFSRDGTSWTEDEIIVSSTIAAADIFGESVAITGDGDKVIVGAYGDDDGGSQAGQVFIYEV